MWMARSTSQRRQQKLLHYIDPRNSFAVFERLNKSSRPTPFGGILKCNWRAAANSRCTLTYTLAAQTSCRHTFDGGGRDFNSRSLVRETLKLYPGPGFNSHRTQNPKQELDPGPGFNSHRPQNPMPGGLTLISIVSGHTASKAPDPIRTRKLSCARPGQYWGGGPPGKPLGCC